MEPRSRSGWLIVLMAFTSCRAPSRAPDTAGPGAKDLCFFLERLVDLDRLAVLGEGERAAQFSSYDRRSRIDPATGAQLDWDANGDSGNYVRVDPATGEAVMAEVEGPGCIWRIWSANPTGRIRFYFDGSTTPDLELGFKEMFRGEGFPFPRPLLWQRGYDLGGDNPASDSYVPIPFARSCRITADRAHGQYYHIGYSTFPLDWNVKTFRLPLSGRERAAVERVASVLSSPGKDPGREPASAMAVEGKYRLKPGESAEILDHESGSGVIREFHARLVSKERWVRRKVSIRMYWDGEPRPSVDVPFGDFFADAWTEAPYASLPMGLTEEGNYCYWRMPFSSGARVVVTNEGARPAELEYRFVVEEKEVAPGTARFRAKWRRDPTSQAFDYPILECRGKGRLVGVSLHPDDLVGLWWGEGDEKVWVDGEAFPSTFGTGSEDYFGDAWGIRRFANPFHGCPTPVSPEAARRQSCYRWHVADDIPFERSFRMTMENYAAKGKVRNDYASVAYWYQLPGGTDFFGQASVEDRVPRGHHVPGAIEAEAILPAELPAGVRVVDDETLPRELSGGKGVEIAGAGGTGVTLSVPAEADGDYTVEVVVARGIPSTATELVRDGQVLGDRVTLTKGANAIQARLAPGGQGGAVIDCLRLHPYVNYVRDWYLIGPFPNTDDAGLDREYGPETEPFDREKAWPGKAGEVRWRRIRAPSGIIEGATCIEDPEDLVAYAYSEIISPDARRASFLLGSDDGVKVWVNGALAHAKHQHRVVTPDEDRFEADLLPGKNTVLVKVDQGGGPWGFALRLDDPDGAFRYAIP